MSRVSPIRILLLSVFLLAGGCTAIPTEDLRNYDQAFQQAKLAGDLVLDKVAPIIAKRQGTGAGCPVTTTGYHSCFDALGILSDGRSNDPRSILIRRAALQTIADYNTVLVAVADGRFRFGSTAQINDLLASAQTLVQLTSVAVPGVPSLFSGAAMSALSGLINQLQTIRSAVELRRALIAGAPTIQKMLVALASDTPTLYDIYLTAKKIEITAAAVKGLHDLQAKAVAEVNAYYNSLQQYVTVLNATSTALNTLTTIAASGRVTTGDIRAIITQAAEIRTKADAFWRAASASPS